MIGGFTSGRTDIPEDVAWIIEGPLRWKLVGRRRDLEADQDQRVGERSHPEDSREREVDAIEGTGAHARDRPDPAQQQAHPPHRHEATIAETEGD